MLNHVESLDVLDVLLFLKRKGTAVHRDELALEARVPVKAMDRKLDLLRSAGVVVEAAQPDHWQLSANAEHIKDIDELANCYARDRATVVNLIASRNLERLKAISEAFRLGGKKS